MGLMGRLGVKKVKGEEAKSAPAAKQAPQQDSAGGGSLLGALGIEKVEQLSPEEQQRKQTEEQLKTVWKSHVRKRVDKGVKQFFVEGKTEVLESIMERPALDLLLAELERLRSRNVIWVQPKRSQNTDPRVEILEVNDGRGGRSPHFVVREEFSDFSLIQEWENGQPKRERQGKGERRTFEATVVVGEGHEYRLVNLVRVS